MQPRPAEVVRIALGADPERIRRDVLAEGLWLAVPGALLGLLAAVPVSRALEGLLWGISTVDPVTFTVVPLVMALVATLVPALRAGRTDPIEALRGE